MKIFTLETYYKALYPGCDVEFATGSTFCVEIYANGELTEVEEFKDIDDALAQIFEVAENGIHGH